MGVKSVGFVGAKSESASPPDSTLHSLMASAILPASILALLGLALPAAAHEWDASRTLKTEIPAADLRSVDFNFGAGTLRIEGTAGSVVRLRVEARCDDDSDRRCEKTLERLRIESDVEGGRLDLEVRGLSNGHVHDLDLEATLEIPRTIALDLDMGAGELEIDGLEGAIDVDLGAGEATIRVPERSVRSVEMAVGIGEATLVRNGKRQEFVRVLASPVRWKEGTGRSRIDVSLGVGQAEVTLR